MTTAEAFFVVGEQRTEEPHIIEARINERIRVPEVRLVGPAGEQVGIVRVEDALRLAQEADLDLVEVAPDARPPVCKLMDYGKFKYEADMKAREARRNQANTVLKEIRFRLKIDPHDYGTKKGHVERFLKAGDKVKIMIMFRGREQSRPEMGMRLLQRLADDVAELGFVESAPRQDGRNMIMVLGPTKKKSEAKHQVKQRREARPEAPAEVAPSVEGAAAPQAPGAAVPPVAPATATAAVEPPAVETPAVETPAVETPVVTPAVETPAVTPAVEAPAVAPVAKPPVAKPAAAAKPVAAKPAVVKAAAEKPVAAESPADEPATAPEVPAAAAPTAAPKAAAPAAPAEPVAPTAASSATPKPAVPKPGAPKPMPPKPSAAAKPAARAARPASATPRPSTRKPPPGADPESS